MSGGWARCPRCGLMMGRDQDAEERHAEACLHDWFMGQALVAMGAANATDKGIAALAKGIADEAMKHRRMR